MKKWSKWMGDKVQYLFAGQCYSFSESPFLCLSSIAKPADDGIGRNTLCKSTVKHLEHFAVDIKMLSTGAFQPNRCCSVLFVAPLASKQWPKKRPMGIVLVYTYLTRFLKKLL